MAPGRLAALGMAVLLLAGAVSAVRSEELRPARSAGVVAIATLQPPVLGPAVERVTPEPMVEERLVGGVPSTVARPTGTAPAVVFLNGATAAGRAHPAVRRVAEGLARAGYVVVVPDLPGIAEGRLTVAAVDAAVRVALAASARPDAAGGRVALGGISTGGALALLAAADPRLEGRLSVVAAVAPYAEVGEVVRIATTGSYRGGGRPRPYRADPYLWLASARSLAAALPSGRDRELVLAALGRVPHDADDPRAAFAAGPPEDLGLGPGGGALLGLLLNRDPDRFEALRAELPREVEEAMQALSPLPGMPSVDAPVRIAAADGDAYFPLAESQRLVGRSGGRATLAAGVGHGLDARSPDALLRALRFSAFLAGALGDAERPSRAAPR